MLKTLKSRSGSAKDAMQASDDVAAAQRVLAAANCKHIKFVDNEDLNLSTECGDRVVGFSGPKDQ